MEGRYMEEQNHQLEIQEGATKKEARSNFKWHRELILFMFWGTTQKGLRSPEKLCQHSEAVPLHVTS